MKSLLEFFFLRASCMARAKSFANHLEKGRPTWYRFIGVDCLQAGLEKGLSWIVRQVGWW